jgi:general secretion pathway protein D
MKVLLPLIYFDPLSLLVENRTMRSLIFSIVMLTATTIFAQEKIRFHFTSEEVSKVLDSYSRASGKKMILDSSIKGKISILNPEPVDLNEAFNQVSQALAMNGYAIINNGETLVVRPVRQVQRSLIEVGSELPSPKPERLFSWVVNLKHIPASVLLKDLRILLSKEGESSVVKDNNQIIFVDWLSNLYRIRELVAQIDIPQNPDIEKILNEYVARQKKKK